MKKDDPYLLRSSQRILETGRLQQWFAYLAGINSDLHSDRSVGDRRAVAICHLVFCIMGAIAVSEGKAF
jgi:hypothetical protein